MSARTDAMLKASGHTGPVISTLESDDAAFVLTTDTLLFQHLGGVRRVTLRDLARIHSDQDGLLHVETPAGTALTANLLGFDPTNVQNFFTKVKDETARAKTATSGAATTSESMPTAAVARAFDSAPPAANPAPPAPMQPQSTPPAKPAAQPAPQTQPVQPSTPAPAPSTQVVNTARESSPKIGWATGAERKPPAQPATTAQPGLQPIARAGQPQTPTPTPPTTTPPKSPTQPQSVPPTSPPPTAPPTSTKPAGLSPTLPPTPTPMPPLSAAPSPVPTVSAAMLTRLTTEAKTAERAAGRLRTLAIVLFVAALGLAASLIFGGNFINGIWVLLAGGVSAVALFTVIDIIRLQVAIAQTLGADQ